MKFFFIPLMAPILLTAVLGVFPSAEANPFRPGGKAEAPKEQISEQGFLTRIGSAIMNVQRVMNRKISVHMRKIRDGESFTPLFVGLLLAFVYGAVHAAGPGHGKLVVVSYFMSREAKPLRGVLMGFQIAISHVISAIVVVWLADYLLRRVFGAVPSEIKEVRLVSYGLIIAIGLYMFVQAIRGSQGGSHGHGHGEACGHQHGFLSISVGLVPCTGAILIMLYALANDILPAGIAMVAAIGLGMAITMSGLGILSILARKYVLSRFEAAEGKGRGVISAFEYGGAVLIMAIGSTFFISAL